MTANRSLDDFADVTPAAEPDDATAGDPPAAADDDAEDVGTADAHEGSNDGEATPGVRSTFVWSPDGGPCAACGGTVEARWRAGEDLVCPDCKDW